ncbi:hypothetical protein OTUT144_0193 [Orientia tsutsugamushi str. UT144]|uniref:Uncharacterized protein n=1 Tax=Orientia tsutsugamushi str. UT144 TaxID=1441384 RepID=A0A0F3RNH6_ORITS|nr:hypothetical protein OTUT144_0193 [Orientia tsutsugamushi str. UT144]
MPLFPLDVIISFNTPDQDNGKHEKHNAKGLQEKMYNYDYVIY